jgi:hypothetical protein
VSKHEEFAAVARNAFLRRHGDRAGIAASFAMGYAVNDLRNRIGQQERPAACISPAPGPRRRRQALVRGGTERRTRQARHLAPHPADAAGAGRYRLGRPVGPLPGVGILPSAHRPISTKTATCVGTPTSHAAVQAGTFATGYMHFILHGRDEGRPRQTRGPQ